ncbi:juvenile hormone esterase-like [Plutella xylostella]|uniref:juvenile hormone esterase-like n=1 Tax=Plutella xylostella TaxID=51655 RepID=UPI002032949B|nr:juvenile hormone esterase-like [Plutella xylostella]
MILTLILLTTLHLHLSTCAVKVKISQGTVLGIRKETVFDKRLYYAFYEIPFARAPIGRLRFKDPRPLKIFKIPYEGDTDFYSPCAQPHIVYPTRVSGGEDCLYLNVYTPVRPDARQPKLPVLVFYHGYAFTSSFSHIYGPDFLIDNGIVHVTVNFRVGVFGFSKLNASDTHANMGLKDMVMSLKWIKSNIARFGGDEAKVTVMGTGSAAALLSVLLTTRARTLFSKMILHSGSMFAPSLFLGDRLAETELFKQNLRKLLGNFEIKTLTKDIIRSSQNIYKHKDTVDVQRPLVPFTLHLERGSNKSLVTRTPSDFYRRGLHKPITTPILIGYNTQESLSEVIPFLRKPNLLGTFTSDFKFMVPFDDGCRYKHTHPRYKEIANKILNHYFKDGLNEKSIYNFMRYTSDLLKYPVLKFIKAHLLSTSTMFVYKFNYNGFFNAVKKNSLGDIKLKVRGAASGDELCYLFRCEPMSEYYPKLQGNETDARIMREMASMWSNFVKAGDPTPARHPGPAWPPVTPAMDHVMFISKTSRLVELRRELVMLKFWNDLYADYYCEEKCNRQDKDEL